MNTMPAKHNPFKSVDEFERAAFTIGVKSGNTIRVGVQLKDVHGRNAPEIVQGQAYISDNADASTLTATVPTSNIAVGTAGVIIGSLTTNKAFSFITNTAGFFDLDIIQTAGGTNYYLVVCLPNGGIFVSGKIAF